MSSPLLQKSARLLHGTLQGSVIPVLLLGFFLWPVSQPHNGLRNESGNERGTEATAVKVRNSPRPDRAPVRHELPPLEMGMENVSATGPGAVRKIWRGDHYEISVSFDPAKIPPGFSYGDILIYRYDNHLHRWSALKTTAVDPGRQVITATSTRDGQFISGVIKTPDAPETQGYTPTTLNNINVGDPASMVNLVEAPTANNRGSANLTYHIETPPGRQGIQPKLDIAYSSDAGESWLGLGWSLSGVSSITLDTRWGAPAYSQTDETETYMLDGEMLAFMHKGAAKTPNRFLGVKRADVTSATQVTQFYTRKQANFSRILRIGSSTDTYRWVITDKAGTRYYYGGSDNLDGQAVVRNEGGARKDIAEWKLTRVEDVFGNFMTFKYSRRSMAVPGVNGLFVYNTYLDSIYYTAYRNPTDDGDARFGTYSITFDHKPRGNIGLSNISARYGFLTAETDSLTGISVFWNDRVEDRHLIRKYKLYYHLGAFAKPLLDSIAQFGRNDAYFNSHRFKYYALTSYFSPTAVDWPSPSDGLSGGSSFPLVDNNSTALGGSKSSNSGFSMYFGLGLLGNPGSKDATVGVEGGSGSSNSEGMNTLVDLSGDGLPDKVFVDRDGIKYHKNNGHGFDADVITVTADGGLRTFSEENSRTSNFGESGQFAGFSVGRDVVHTESTTSTFFADVNGDGLMDIVSNNAVFFNCGYKSGNTQQFSLFSSKTSVPIQADNPVSGFVPAVSDGKRDSLQNDNPLQEVVRVWEAPFDGQITISAPVSMVPVSADDQRTRDYDKADGIRVAIEADDMANRIVDSASIPKGRYDTVLTQAKSLSVHRGNHVYFRLQSGVSGDANGSFDRVLWRPQITYDTHIPDSAKKDIYGKSIYRYDISEDYLLSDINGVALDSGITTFSVTGTVVKKPTMDTVTLSVDQYRREDSTSDDGKFLGYVYRFDKRLFAKSYAPEANVRESLNTGALAIDTPNRVFRFSVSSGAVCNTQDIQWRPVVNYETRFAQKCVQPDGSVADCNPPQIKVTPRKIFTVPDYLMADTLQAWGGYWKVTDSQQYKVLSYVEFRDTVKKGGELLFTIRDSASILHRVRVPYHAGQRYSEPVESTVVLDKSDTYQASYESQDTSVNPHVLPASFEFKRSVHKAQLLIKGVPIRNGDNDTIGKAADYRVRIVLELQHNISKGQLLYEFTDQAGRTLGAVRIGYDSNRITTPLNFLAMTFPKDQVIMGRITSTDSAAVANITEADFYCNEAVSSFLWTKRIEGKFGPMYRGWGQFIYNGMRGRAASPIVPDLLQVLKPIAADKKDDVQQIIAGLQTRNQNTPVQIQGIDTLSPTKAAFVMMAPYADSVKRRWQGGVDDIYLTRDSMSSSRLGLSDVIIVDPFVVAVNPAGPDKSFAYGIQKLVYSDNESVFGGYGPVTITKSQSTNNTMVISDFLDINGDRFPDIVGQGQVQLTNAKGSLAGKAVNTQGVHQSKDGSTSVGMGGDAPHSYTVVTKMQSNGTAQKAGANDAGANGATMSASPNVGATGSGSIGSEETLETWMDVNGDGLADKVFQGSVALNLGNNIFTPRIAYNTGHITQGENIAISPGISLGFNFSNKSASGGIGMSLSNAITTFNLLDINGDGLPDQVAVSDKGDVAVAVNTGFGFLPPVNVFNVSVPLSDIQTVAHAATLPIGYLPRIPGVDVFGGAINRWIDLDRSKFNSSVGQSIGGSFTFGFNVWIPFTPLIRFVFNPGVNKSNGVSKTVRQFADIDGDGFPDFLYSTDENTLKVQYSTLGKVNKLSEVDNPLGGSFSLDYQHVDATGDDPGGRWVMSSLQVNDGDSTDRETVGAGFDVKKEYNYSSGRYDRYERQFLSFGRVETRDVGFDGKISRKRVDIYDTANYYVAGNLLRTAMTDAHDNVYQQSRNDYYLFVLLPSGDDYSRRALASNRDIRTGLFTGICYTAVQRNTEENFEGTPQGIILNQSLYAYDTTGGVQTFKYRQGGAVSDTGYDYVMQVSYKAADWTKYLLNLPANVRVSKGAVVFRNTTVTYTPLGKPDTIARQLADTSNDITALTYNRFGEVITKRLANGLVYLYTYDNDKTMSYVTKVVDISLNFASETLYDYDFGVPKRIKDINDNLINYELDAFGRTVRVIGPMECDNDIHNVACKDKYSIRIGYNLAGSASRGVSSALVTHFDSTINTGIRSVRFVDGLKRTIQIKKSASVFNEDGTPNAKARWIVSGRDLLDAMGRVVKRYWPTLDSTDGGDKLATRPNAVAPTLFTYDVMDRVLVKTFPDGQDQLRTTYTLENGLSLATSVLPNDALDGGDQVRKIYLNGSGLKQREMLLGNGGPVVADYGYDPIHQLSSQTDARGNATLMTYDYAGNLTQVNHPDAGLTKYVYDPAGQLVRKLTPNGDTVTYGYDFNRLVTTTYSRHPENNVRYMYGANDANCVQCRNRIVYREDASGSQAFEYGVMGEVTKTTRTIIVPFTDRLYTFVTGFAYDSWNRIRSITYPDNEKVVYAYNAGGLLQSVTGTRGVTGLGTKYKRYKYVSQIKYDQFEQRVSMTYGNNVTEAYSYKDLRRRVTAVAFTGINPASPFLGSLTTNFQYDNQSNIQSLVNIRQLGRSQSQMTHHYIYDAYNQLDSAYGNWTNGPESAGYQVGLGYDDAFDITHRQLNLSSAKSGTAVVRIDSRDTLTYGAGHRLRQIMGTGHRNGDPAYMTAYAEKYGYDNAGNNILKSVADNSGHDGIEQRKILWDEDNRILAVSMGGFVSNYVYDADGNRAIKMSTEGDVVSFNGKMAGSQIKPSTFTLYANPYYSMRNGNGLYTKHIYINNERIASEVEGDAAFDNQNLTPDRENNIAVCQTTVRCVDTTGYVARRVSLNQRINASFDYLEVPHAPIRTDAFITTPVGTEYSAQVNPFVTEKKDKESLPRTRPPAQVTLYFYHANQVGSTSFVTDSAGNVVQYLEYLPYGEVFMELRNKYSSQYLFDGKEQDPETGLYYYGARYYDPHTYQWLGVDPRSPESPGISPYAYCFNNPVRMTDPDGKFAFLIPLVIEGIEAFEVYEAAQVAATAAVTTGIVVTGSAAVYNQVRPGNQYGTKEPTFVLNEAHDDGEEKSDVGSRRKNRLPDKGVPNSTKANPSGTTIKKYGPDGNVQKEFNKGHTGENVEENERDDHVHDYEPRPRNPTGLGERLKGRPPVPGELEKDFKVDKN